ncbi:MAG: chromate transporter [Muribaculaceae bacterium]|nr:chromate transporter [Muribaculaceae bacterium]
MREQEKSLSQEKNPQQVTLTRLFLTFAKIGAFTFGGGWAMISIIEREIVHKYHWLKQEEFLDLLAVAQSMPGILAVNISVVVGDKLRNLTGSIIAALGTIMPSFSIILLIAIFLTPETITTNPALTAIFKGIRPVVVALIVAPVITSARSMKLTLKMAWIPAIVALLIWSKWPVISNPILFIVLGGLGGWWHLRRSRLALEKSGQKGGEA